MSDFLDGSWSIIKGFLKIFLLFILMVWFITSLSYVFIAILAISALAVTYGPLVYIFAFMVALVIAWVLYVILYAIKKIWTGKSGLFGKN